MARPMAVRFGALGDMVLMTVAIQALCERFGSPVDILGSGEWTRSLLQGQPGIGDIFLLHSRTSPYWTAPDQWQLVRALRRRGSGPTWLFDARIRKVRWLFTRAGWRADDLVSLDELPDVAGEHFCDRWRRFSALTPRSNAASRARASEQTASAYPQLSVSHESTAELKLWLRALGIQGGHYILIQPGNKRTMHGGNRRRASNMKYWPERCWAEVLRGLTALHPKDTLLLLGVGPEARINDEILALAKVSNAHNLAHGMTIPRLMALAAEARGMISVDTGPAHVAAALRCPVLTLFDSPAKLAMYAPRGPDASISCLVGGTDAAPSMLGIEPQAILAAWHRMHFTDMPVHRDSV